MCIRDRSVHHPSVEWRFHQSRLDVEGLNVDRPGRPGTLALDPVTRARVIHSAATTWRVRSKRRVNPPVGRRRASSWPPRLRGNPRRRPEVRDARRRRIHSLSFARGCRGSDDPNCRRDAGRRERDGGRRLTRDNFARAFAGVKKPHRYRPGTVALREIRCVSRREARVNPKISEIC